MDLILIQMIITWGDAILSQQYMKQQLTCIWTVACECNRRMDGYDGDDHQTFIYLILSSDMINMLEDLQSI